MSLLSSPKLNEHVIPQIWGLVLDSFKTVGVQKLIETKILDSLIKAFVNATTDV